MIFLVVNSIKEIDFKIIVPFPGNKIERKIFDFHQNQVRVKLAILECRLRVCIISMRSPDLVTQGKADLV